MSQTDQRAVAKVLAEHMMIAATLISKINNQRNRIAGGYEISAEEPGPINLIAHALADAERRGLERAAKVVEQMKIQTCAIRNETAIIHELLLKVESRIEKVATLEKQIRAQAQADKEG